MRKYLRIDELQRACVSIDQITNPADSKYEKCSFVESPLISWNLKHRNALEV